MFGKGRFEMNVLLIGDSIRMFYREEVQKQLGEEYTVYSPEENCRFSSYVLNSLRQWLPQFPIPDIIHFNAGLWDTAVLYPEDGCFTDRDTYVKQMMRILRELKKTGAKVIFATSTPVSDEKVALPGPMPPAHRNADVMAYNEAVLEAYKNEDIIIDDLFSLMYPDKERYLSEDMIHPNEEGVRLLGKAVADSIRSCGKVKNQHEQRGEVVKPVSEKVIQ